MNKTFSSLSRQECKIAYKEILCNSDELWESGLLLANSKRYGHATPFLINSVEELVKSLILFFDSEGFQFRQTRGVDIFFRNHQIRYIIAYAMFCMNIFGDELMRFFQKVRENPHEIIRMHQEMKGDENYVEHKLKLYILRKIILLRKEFDWFSQLDIFRQDGFYSNYERELKTPLNINQQDFEQVLIRLDKIRKLAKVLVESFQSTDPSIKENITKLRRDFKQKDYYGKITAALSSIKQDRDGPFQHIKKKIQNNTI